MPLLDIRKVQVNFPFQPYPCQIDYMNKVIECLQEGTNGVLESPTGTGKTLCLLCSSLAWQESRKAQAEFNKQVSVSHLLGANATGGEGATGGLSEKGLEGLAKSLENSTGTSWGGSDFAVPKIIYASRTHSQLSQVVQELKRTAYNSVKVSVIGSRDQLCIHEQVKKEQNNTNKVHMCRAKVNARTCYYYNHLSDLKNNAEPRTIVGNVVDIEDLVASGQKNRFCPYYMARELKSDADIIFMPYNYLLDPKTRKAHGVELQNNVVIFDEAHNLEKICEDSASFDLKPGDLATAIEELTKLATKFLEMIEDGNQLSEDNDNDIMPDFTLDDILRLKGSLVDLEQAVDKVEVHTTKGLTKPGIFMYELLAKANIVYGTKDITMDVLDKIVSYITTDASGAGSGITKGAGLSKVADILKIIFSQELAPGSSLANHEETMSRSYKVHLHMEDANKKKKQLDLWTSSNAAEKTGKTLSYWCFSPGHSMRDLLAHGIKCIVLTSGTLSPLESFTAELQIPFPVRLENPHVIEKHQVWIGALRQGPDGSTLNSNYQTRFTAAYQCSLGNAVVNFARVVPNGLLIFFPSYTVLEKCLDQWKVSNIWSRVEQYKQIFVEPRAKGILNDLMNDFYGKINDEKLNGAIFIAVCRGKVSEGLDFSDINGRAVVITGLPYPPYLDPKVVLKMAYLDEMRGKQGFQSLTGKEWYKQQASRAVNQAIGRVIRHKEDFGAIILCDTRFANAEAVRQLPVWVRPHVGKYDTFGAAVKDIMFFFKHAEKIMPAPKPSQKSREGMSAGAHFMPTITRTGAGPGVVQPSHAVHQHVPSLRSRDNATVSNDNLRQHYTGSFGSGASSGASQKNLLSALDRTEKSQHSLLSDTQIPSFQSSVSNMEMRQQHSKKKKIVIRKRESGSSAGADSKDSGTEVASQGAMSNVNSAEDYIAQVKSILNGDLYKVFSTAMVQYKKTEDIDALCEILSSLFIDDTTNYHLFAKFYRFVRTKHKHYFSGLCRQLTGMSVEGDTAEKTSDKKRGPSQLDNHSHAKKQRTDSTGSSVKESQSPNIFEKMGCVREPVVKCEPERQIQPAVSSKSSNSNVPVSVKQENTGSSTKTLTSNSEVHVNGENISQKSSVNSLTVSVKQENTSSSTKTSNSKEPVKGDNISQKSSINSDKTKTRTLINSENTRSLEVEDSLPSRVAGACCQGDTGAACGSGQRGKFAGCHGEVGSCAAGESQGSNTGNKNLDFAPKSGEICCVCNKDARVPFISQCQHVCCMSCWREVFDGDKLCPTCKKRVRRRHLTRLIFPKVEVPS